MSEPEFHIACLGDPRLAAHATSSLPTWLWTPDATRVLWANPVAAAILGATSPTTLAQRQFDTGQPAPAQIARLAPNLPHDVPPRLERLRGLGAGAGRALTCLCARISVDSQLAILVTATERAGPDLSLAERVRRLLADTGQALAAFTPEGKLMHATRAALVPLGGAQSLAALGAETLAAEALRDGVANARLDGHAVSVARIGADDETVLLATFTAVEAAELTPPPVPIVEVESPAASEPEAPEPEDVHAVSAAPESEATPTESEPATPEPVAPAPPPPEAFEPEPEPSPPPVAQEPEPPATPETPPPDETSPLATPAADRRHPLRFVWQMDADSRFTLGPGEFPELIGPNVAAKLGRPWNEIASDLAIDPEGQVARAIGTRDTWSGIEIAWPLDGTDQRFKVELSGLPVFDRDRNFGGYRGFGVCRDLDLIEALIRARHAPQQATPSETPNVVPFRAPAAAADGKTPTLSPVEHTAFRELARKLTARLKENGDKAPAETENETSLADTQFPPVQDVEISAPSIVAPTPDEGAFPTAARLSDERERPILDRLPIGVLVYRRDALLYANRAFLDWTGYADLDAMAAAGGLDNLFVESGIGSLDEDNSHGTTLAITTVSGDKLPVEGRLFRAPWDGEQALVLMLVPAPIDDRHKAAEMSLRLAEAEKRELKSILDIATVGVVVVDREGYILSANRSAEALFGYGAQDIDALNFADVFAPESRSIALDYLEALKRNDTDSMLSDGREVIGSVRSGGQIPLFMTMGPIADGTHEFCAVFRDLTQWKKAEEELIAARREAEKASSAKSEFLAKISHEIRTPLNAIIGFSEVMMDERFGPMGNERYREYLKDIHASGGHVVSLLNDLLDLSKIEAGKLDLNFGSLNLNELTQQCVAIMQPQANRERIIIRSSLAAPLPPIVADARSVRQIVLNLLSNSVKFTGAGGQVIVSTAHSDAGDVVLRVRDTGIGMSEQDIATALEPFRQLATSARWGSGGSGLGLPLTKALAEANHARFAIQSEPNAGTLVEICFPSTRIAAE